MVDVLVGRGYVDVRPDYSNFDRDLQAKSAAAGDGASGVFSAAFKKGLIGLGAAVGSALTSQLAGFAVAGAAASTSLVQGMATVKVAFDGVGAAIQKANKGFDTLSPSAHRFVTEMAGLDRQFQTVRAAAQAGLFPKLGSAVQSLAGTYFPILRVQLGATGKALGDVAKHAAAVLDSRLVSGNVTTILSTNVGVVRNLGTAFVNVLPPITTLFAAFSPMAQKIGEGARGLADFFAAAVSGAQRSGALTTWVKATETGMHLLGQALSSVLLLAGHTFTLLAAVGAPILAILLKTITALATGLDTGVQHLRTFGTEFVSGFTKGTDSVYANQSAMASWGAAAYRLFARARTAGTDFWSGFTQGTDALFSNQSRMAAWGAAVYGALAQARIQAGNFWAALTTAGGGSGVGGALGSGLRSMLTGMLGLIQQIAGAFRSAFAGASLGQLVAPLLAAFRQLAPIAVQVFGLLHQFSALGLFERLAPQIAQLVGVLARALLPALGQVAQALTGALGTALATITPVIGKVTTLLGSTLGSLLQTLAPVLTQVISTVTGVLTALLPVAAQVISALVSALAPVISALLPVIGQIATVLAGTLGDLLQALAPVLVIVARAFGQVVAAVAPLVGTVLSALAPILSAVLPLVSLLGGVLGQIAQAAAQLVPPLALVISQIAAALMPVIRLLVPIIAQLVSVLVGALGPILSTVARSFGQIVTAVAPLLPVIGQVVALVVGLAARILSVVLPVLSALVGFLARIVSVVVSSVLPVVTLLITVFVRVGTVILSGVLLVLRSLIAFLGAQFRTGIELVRIVFGAVFEFVGRYVSAQIAVVRTVISGVVAFFKGPFMTAVHAVAGFFSDAFDRARQIVSDSIGTVIRTVSSMAGKIKTAVSDAGQWLYDAGKHVIEGLIGGVTSMAKSALSAVTGIGKDIVNGVKSFFGIHSPSTVFAEIGGHLIGGLIKGIIGNAHQFPAVLRKVFGMAAHLNPIQWLAGHLGSVGNLLGQIPDLAKTVVEKAGSFLGNIPSSVVGLFSKLFGGGSGGSGVSRWTGVVQTALAMLGQPMSWVPTVLRRMNQESGGNPTAINKWDINAQHGDPSRGLMQVIGATFNAFAGPLRSRGIYDPLANTYAGLAYALKRYGSLSALNRPGGYDSGGWLYPNQLAINHTRVPEAVLNPQQWADVHTMVSHLLSGQSGGSVAQFTGDLFLDSGEWLGTVRGVARQEVEAHGAATARAMTHGRK